MDTDREALEEKNRLLIRIIDLQDEVERLRKQVRDLTDQLEEAKAGAGEDKVAEEKRTSKQYDKKDTTKYKFEGAVYRKNRLVLAVVRRYAELNPGISAEELMRVFDKKLQGSLGVVRLAEEVKDTYTNYERRFFMDKNEVIHTSSGTVAVSSQWQASTIDGFIEYAKTLGMQIQVVE